MVIIFGLLAKKRARKKKMILEKLFEKKRQAKTRMIWKMNY